MVKAVQMDNMVGRMATIRLIPDIKTLSIINHKKKRSKVLV